MKKLRGKMPKRTVRDRLPMISNKLKCVNVHKISDWQRCKRYYFWCWVRNLVPKRLNIAFFYGSLVHKGVECISAGYSPEKTRKIMEKEARKLLRKNSTKSVNMEEVEIMQEIGIITVLVYMDLFGNELSKWKQKYLEKGFRIKLNQSPVYLTGTIDKYMKKNNNVYMNEYKTAKRVDDNYFKKLRFNKQINAYAVGVSAMEGKIPCKCVYIVFKKPSIWVRQTETPTQFLQRYKDDLYARPDFYFIREDFRFGKSTVMGVFDDIESETFDMYSKYNYHSKEDLLKPKNWPKNDSACTEYGICPYIMLCRNLNNWELYTKGFQMRDIRYALEVEELEKPKLFAKRLTTKEKAEIK